MHIPSSHSLLIHRAFERRISLAAQGIVVREQALLVTPEGRLLFLLSDAVQHEVEDSGDKHEDRHRVDHGRGNSRGEGVGQDRGEVNDKHAPAEVVVEENEIFDHELNLELSENQNESEQYLVERHEQRLEKDAKE